MLSIGQLWTFLGVALPALAALLVPMPAVDLAYQLRAGAEILAGNGIPTADAWTFTVAGTPWLDQQWGAQVLLAAVYELGGWTALAILRAAMVGLTFGLVIAALRSIGCASRPAALLALGGFVLAAPALALRPQLFAIVLFAATQWILVDRSAHPRRLWLIPLIAIAWANLHGSFPLVLVLIALTWLDELARSRAPRPVDESRPATAPPRPSDRIRGSTGLALIGAVAALATLVNPFGIDVWRYVASLASNPAIASQVSEWRPPSPLDPAGAVFYASLAAALAVVVLRWRADGGRLGPSAIAPLATLLVFGVLGAVTGRGLAWWALAAPVAVATLAHGAPLTDQLPRRLRPLGTLFRGPARDRRSRLNDLVAAALVVAGIALLPLWRPVGPAGVPAGTLSHAPQGIARELIASSAIARLGTEAHVWNPQAWGSWLEWAAPHLRYAVDSRIELFPADIWADAQQIAAVEGDWLAALDRHKVDAIVVPAANVELAAALTGIWSLAYQDPDGSIFIRPQL